MAIIAVEKSRGWNPEEMRSAAATNSQLGTKKFEYPVVSRFTPINLTRTAQVAENEPPPNKMASSKKPEKMTQGPKRRRITSSAARKAGKPSGARKGKRSKKAGEVQCQDISQGLSRTKPILSRNGVLPDKNGIPSEAALQREDVKVELLSGAPAESRDIGDVGLSAQLRPSGLAEKYQDACAVANHNGIDPSLLYKGHEVQGAPEDLVAVVAAGNLLKSVGKRPPTEVETGVKPWGHENESFQEFVPPPSAQGERIRNRRDALPVGEDFGLTKAASQDFFNSDDVFGDSDEDEFTPRDDGLAEIMQSVDPSGKFGGLDDGWRPEEFTDDSSIFEDLDFEDMQPNETSSHWALASTQERTQLAPGNGMNGSPDVENDRPSRVLSQTSGNAIRANPHGVKLPVQSEDCFDDDDLDEDLADLTVNGSDIIQPLTPITLPEKPSTPKLQWMPPKTYTPANSSQMPPSTAHVPHHVPVNRDRDALPFTRPPFPKPIRDRSPILGLSNQTVLRTCFRIGEALNAAAVASRSNFDAIIELYARIVLSEREANKGFKQFFQFKDLFTDKPPYLSGTFSLWKGVELWDVDSRVFVGEKGRGKMARVMGRIKRCERGGGCEMVVLSIWEVDWEDVGVAKGIVCS